MRNLNRFNEDFDWDEVLKQNRKEGTEKWSSLEKDMMDIAEKYEGQFGPDSYGVVDAMYQVLDGMFQKKESKKEESEEIKFDVKSLERDKDEKPSFKTKVEDNEKVQKEFKKSMDKIEKFESFITISISNDDDDLGISDEFGKPTDEYEVDKQSSKELRGMDFLEDEESETPGCCDDCTGEEGCVCCDDCNCRTEEVNPDSDVKVMNIQDFIGSLNK